MSVYAIGDIHGCYTALKTLLDSVPFAKGDQIVFLGDYIDRGPGSAAVIDLIIGLSKKMDVVTLRGNHEIMMLNSRKHQQILSNWMVNGGFQTLDSYRIGDEMDWYKKIPDEHWDLLEKTKSYYEKDQYIFVHAGLTPGIALNEQTDAVLFWEHQWDPPVYDENKIVICGHTPQKEGKPRVSGNTIFIDTYAFGGLWLTCLQAESGKFWQADQKGRTNTGHLSNSV